MVYVVLRQQQQQDDTIRINVFVIHGCVNRFIPFTYQVLLIGVLVVLLYQVLLRSTTSVFVAGINISRLLKLPESLRPGERVWTAVPFAFFSAPK